MNKIKQIFRESFYGNTQDKNCVLEFTYPQLKQFDLDEMVKKFSDLLNQIGVDFSNNYMNINKFVVICKQEKVDEVKNIGKSLDLTLQKELIPDARETNHL
jgi:hypothetical protein